MDARCRTLFQLALLLGASPGICQSLVYTEPGVASCSALRPETAARTVQRGVPVSGSVRVTCGFAEGSYTVTLNSTDPEAAFSPKTMLVNFGRLVGSGTFTVRFSTTGLHSVSAAISSNMGSPALRGRFSGGDNKFNVMPP
jgi:hypothetical protein